MATSEFDLIAILYPAEGKSGRIIQLLKDVIAYVQTNEPGTLKYEMYKEQRGDDIIMVEKYADKAAFKKHGQSEVFQKFQNALKEENLVRAAPTFKMATSVVAVKRESKL